MNEEYELKKIVKIGAIVGGVWGFVNGLFLILSSVDSAPNTTFFGNFLKDLADPVNDSDK